MSNNLTITENPAREILRQFRGKALWTALATMVDAEGNISIRKSKTKWNPIYTPYVKLGNSDINWLDAWAWRLSRGKLMSNGRVPVGCKPMFKVEIIRRADVVYILKHILPFLVCKRQQAELALEFLEKRVIYRLEDGASKFSKRVPQQELDWREDCFQKMLKLNARGIPRDYMLDIPNEDSDIVPPVEPSTELGDNVQVQ